MENIHENLEQAEHASHHAANPFDRRVAVSMAIVAACLAGISMIGHRTHNKVLQLQGDANRLRTEAAAAEVERSNLFAWYQSKRLRQSQFETVAGLAKISPGNDDIRKKTIEDWEKQARSYLEPNTEHDSLPELRQRGMEAGKRVEKLTAEAVAAREEAEHVHHQADRLDIAHLGSEVSLVVCSLALLTKRRGFWFLGLAACVIAIVVAASAYTIPHEAHPAAMGADHSH